jgi:hypothetical protein
VTDIFTELPGGTGIFAKGKVAAVARIGAAI